MKYALLIGCLWIACSATSQITLTPNNQGRFCTDTAGVRAIAKALKELEYTRLELGQYDQLTENLIKELELAQRAQAQTDSLLNQSLRQKQKLQADLQLQQKQRWWFGGSGFLLGIIFILLL